MSSLWRHIRGDSRAFDDIQNAADAMCHALNFKDQGKNEQAEDQLGRFNSSIRDYYTHIYGRDD
jgi:hypothetical protein